MSPARIRTSGKLLGMVTLMLATSLASAQPQWLDPAASPDENAHSAERAGVDAGTATREIVAVGTRSDVTVQAVIRNYGSCNAVTQSVEAATRADPDHAPEIVNASAAVARCPCSGQSLWAKARLERRIRLEGRRQYVAITTPCACIAAAAEAAVSAAPAQADRVVAAALAASRRASAVVDSIGQVGATTGPGAGVSAWLQRRSDRACARDTAPDDRFDAAQQWQAGSGVGASVAPSCENRDGDNDSEETSATALRMETYGAEGNDTALVLANSTGRDVDLAGEGYQLEVYFPGSTEVGRRVDLMGLVPARGNFLIVGSDAGSDLRQRADFVSPLARFAPSDALVLRRGLGLGSCECASAAVAGVANGLGADGQQWMNESAGENAENGDDAKPLARTADSLGQVRPEQIARGDWRPPLAPVPLVYSRRNDNCRGDMIADDTFTESPLWVRDGLGFAPACPDTPPMLLLSDYRAQPVNDDRAWREVKLFNNTGVGIDLAAQGYVLEVFENGTRDPSSVIALKGKVDSGRTHIVVSDSAPDDIRRQAQSVERKLDTRALDAVVLRRISTDSTPSCPVDVYAALRSLGPPPILLGPTDPIVLEGDPRPDDPVVDPNRGGDLASPN
jgi:hypothetical protein